MPHFEVFHLYKPMTIFKLVQVNHLCQRLWIYSLIVSFTQIKLKPGNNGNPLPCSSNTANLQMFPDCVWLKV